MNISEGIKNRWSPRAFDSKAIDEEILKEIFIAAGSAPSAFNEQPWRYLVGIKGDETYDKIFNCLDEFNQKWAITAPVLAIGLISKSFSKNNKSNHYAKHDLGSATAYLTMRAIEANVYVHQMAGFSTNEVLKQFDVSTDFEAITAIALGFTGDINNLPQEYQAGEKKRTPRKEINEIVFYETWNKPKF